MDSQQSPFYRPHHIRKNQAEGTYCKVRVIRPPLPPRPPRAYKLPCYRPISLETNHYSGCTGGGYKRHKFWWQNVATKSISLFSSRDMPRRSSSSLNIFSKTSSGVKFVFRGLFDAEAISLSVLTVWSQNIKNSSCRPNWSILPKFAHEVDKFINFLCTKLGENREKKQSFCGIFVLMGHSWPHKHRIRRKRVLKGICFCMPTKTPLRYQKCKHCRKIKISCSN